LPDMQSIEVMIDQDTFVTDVLAKGKQSVASVPQSNQWNERSRI